MLPGLTTTDQLVEKLHLFQTREQPEVVRVQQAPNRLEVTLDTAQYRPDELEINVVNNELVVEASHRENRGDQQRTSRQFKKR